MLAWTVLFGATINSMLVAHYHPPSNSARLFVLSSSAIAVLIWSVYRGDLSTTAFLVNVTALIMMGLMLWKMFAHLARREARTHLAEREMIMRSEEAERLALVAKYASDGVLLMDADLNIMWVNQQFTNTTGYTAEFAVGRKP